MHGDRNAVPIENATKNSVSSNISSADNTKYAHVQSGVRNMTRRVNFPSHARRGARQSCERLPARPVVVAECSFVVSVGILVLRFAERFEGFGEATGSAFFAVKSAEYKPPD